MTIKVLTLWLVVSPVEVVPDVISSETYFNLLCFCRLMYYINSESTQQISLVVQWSAVTVTPSGIGISVTITDSHCDSVTLIVDRLDR